MLKNNYTLHSITFFNKSRTSPIFFVVGVLLLLILTSSFSIEDKKRADYFKSEALTDPVAFDLFLVTVFVEGAGSFDLDVLYTDNNLLFINVKDLFKALKIPCAEGLKGSSLEGFIGNGEQAYSINFGSKQIKVGEKMISSQDKLLKESGALYMDSSLFTKVFGITLDFNYRSLTIKLKADFELPIVKQIRRDKIRSNIAKVKGELVADTVISRDYHLFKLGTLDWSASSFLNWKGTTNNAVGLNVGTELLHGEANVSLNYNDQFKFDNRQVQYLWRWIDNDKTFIKQAQIGKINIPSISFINAPIVGASIRNTPTTVRKAKGSYIINEITEPNWIVELYINDILIDFVTADASGAFIFTVPIVYGFTTIKLRYYGPTGEERTEEREMNVPYTVMPVNEVGYALSAAIVQDSIGSHFAKGEFNYGVNRFLTIGGGLEYLSSLPGADIIPFAKATVQPTSKLTINGEYAHGVSLKGLLNYYVTKDVLLELDYAKYVEGQKVTIFNASEERKARVSLPFKFRKVNGFFRFDYSQLVYTTFNYNYSNLTFSTYYRRFNANVLTQLNWIDQKSPYITSDLAFSYTFKNNYVLRSLARYNATNAVLISYRTELEKRIAKGFISASFQRNIQSKDFYLNVGCKYDFSFARATVSTSQSKFDSGTSISAQGSLAFGGGNGYVHSNANSSIGRGGILLYPFLDLNQNGVLDNGEHLVKITAARVNGGRAFFNKNDSIVRIPNLNSFTNYIITFDDADLDNIAWRFKHKTYQVLIDPNQFKRIDVPILSMGEISGMTYIEKENSLKGIGRISIKIYKKDSDKVVTEILSESDGYLYNLGLKPGDYRACIDPEQLSNLDFVAEPACRYFTIKTSKEGDIVEGIDFILRESKKEF
ncbi:MAG: hypothetical protein ACI96G_000919 [Flavobacterium sp.]|jgi:hypothetical protein